MIPVKTEFLELIHQEDKLASVTQDSTQLSTDHVSNPTVTLILSALNVSKVSNSVSSVLLQRRESSNFQKASVSVWTDIMLIQITLVFLANQDVEPVLQLPTVHLALLCHLLILMDHAHVPTRLTLLSQLMESDIVMLVDLTVSNVQTQLLA